MSKIAKSGNPLPLFSFATFPIGIDYRALVTRNGWGDELTREAWKGFYFLGIRLATWRV